MYSIDNIRYDEVFSNNWNTSSKDSPLPMVTWSSVFAFLGCMTIYLFDCMNVISQQLSKMVHCSTASQFV